MALALDNLKNPLELLFLFRAAQRLEIDELSNTAHAPLVCGISQQDNPLAGIGAAGDRQRPPQVVGGTIVDEEDWRAGKSTGISGGSIDFCHAISHQNAQATSSMRA